MAGNEENMGNGQAEQKFREEVSEHLWTIQDLRGVMEYLDFVEAETFEFETGKLSEFKTKWLVGPSEKPGVLYWRLLEANGFEEGRVQATLNCAILNGDSTVDYTGVQKGTLKVGRGLPVQMVKSRNPSHHVNGEDVIIQLKLTIMLPESKGASADLKVQQFHKSSAAHVLSNFVGLLGDEATADLKIVTSDGKELLAHKAILKAQCPVFETMFRSDMSENKTGIVNVKDVNSKTMGIFLHYFYSGVLLPFWKDQDTVVEFTYAVGKYQLTNVLKLLDEVLGSRDEEDATHVDMQLLDLAEKLGLKVAEKELVERIKRTMSRVNTAEGLFALYGFGGIALHGMGDGN